MRRLSQVLLVSMLLIVVGAIAAWIAVGRLADAVERSLVQVEESIETAKLLATTTAASAAEVETVVETVGDGLGSTGDALASTRQVSANVRQLLEVVDFFNRVDDLKGSLEEAEASLQAVETSLSEASISVQQAGPSLHQTVLVLQKIPGQLDATLVEARLAREGVGNQTFLWRVAIVVGCLAVLGGLWSVRQIARAQTGARPDLA